LNADHIKPVAKGGSNRIENLVTSCFDCNSGKSDRELSDTSAIDKSRAQLEISQEKLSQIEMMSKWAESMVSESQASWELADNLFCKLSNGYRWPEDECRRKLINLCKKYTLEVVLKAIPKALEYSSPKDLTMFVLRNACNILTEPPEVSKSKYCRAIYKNRFKLHYNSFKLIEDRAMDLIKLHGEKKAIDLFKTLDECYLDTLLDIHNI